MVRYSNRRWGSLSDCPLPLRLWLCKRLHCQVTNRVDCCRERVGGSTLQAYNSDGSAAGAYTFAVLRLTTLTHLARLVSIHSILVVLPACSMFSSSMCAALASVRSATAAYVPPLPQIGK
jgi:hypothetical protein